MTDIEYLCMLYANIGMTIHEYIHNDIFEFEAGGSIAGLKVTYHCSDRMWKNGDERKVIWICHALTANSDASDWWPELVGAGGLNWWEPVSCSTLRNTLSSVPTCWAPLTVHPVRQASIRKPADLIISTSLKSPYVI